MALLESLSGFSVKALLFSALAVRRATRPAPIRLLQDQPLPALPWLERDPDIQPSGALPPPLPPTLPCSGSAPASSRKGFKPTPELTAKQLVAWGESTRSHPLGKHPVQMHAFTLLNWINDAANGYVLDSPNLSKGKPARGIFAYQLEEAYILMCAEAMWWKPLRWEGSNGVAEHFRRLTKRKKGYRYTVIDGVERRLCFYPVPVSAPVPARKKARRTPEPTPKRVREPLRKAA